MTRFYLVRHGQTIWHAENRYCGSSDIDLSPVGQEQAKQLATWAATQRIDAIYHSHLTRARDTAAPTAIALHLTPTIDRRLRELDFGQGEGLTAAEMSAKFPDAWAGFRHDPVAHPLPGGEDPHDLVAQANEAFRQITASHNDGHVLVIAHSTATRLMLCHWLGIPLRSYRRLFPVMENGAITEFDYDGNAFALRRYNAPLTTQKREPG
jgi:probable phosphoglycerate mutase